LNQEKIKLIAWAVESDYCNIGGICVLKNNESVYENYFNGYRAEDFLHVTSVTKSVFSALVGIAIDRGFIKNIDQKIKAFFPDYKVPETITIKHMLTMTAPYRCETEPYEAFFMSEHWLDFALHLLDGENPAGEFRYSPLVGIHIMAGVLAKATGKSVLDFAQEHLFAPLGISKKHNIFLRTQEDHLAFMADKTANGWVVDADGIHPAGWGLTLTAREMAQFGQLYLNGGVWQDQQIVPKSWIAESTKVHSRWNALGFGYLWWIPDENSGVYAALGDGGNAVYVNPSEKIVVSIACRFVPDARDSMDFIERYIKPALYQ
jgi:CubicO group peptidase (beta-lactamase class C family)